MYVRTHVCMYLRMYVCTYVCICVCMYVLCMYVCMRGSYYRVSAEGGGRHDWLLRHWCDLHANHLYGGNFL